MFSAEGKAAYAMERVERLRQRHNAIPRWRVFKRQDAAREYRYALVDAAMIEFQDPWAFHFETTGHSCGQIEAFYYCTECSYTFGIDPRPSKES